MKKWLFHFIVVTSITILLLVATFHRVEVFAAEDLNSIIVYEPPLPRVRIGSEGDGGYVICDGLEYDCFLSAGIETNIDFEDAFLDKHPHLTCHAFDGSVDSLPAMRNADKMQFRKLFVGGSNTETYTDMRSFMAVHNNIMVKMDIEGGEYDWLLALTDSEMKKIRQIVIEFHDPFSSPQRIECLKKLANTHWLVHFHANTCPGNDTYKQFEGATVPSVFECTYINKNLADVLPRSIHSIPHPTLDRQNCHFENDIVLRGFPYST